MKLTRRHRFANTRSWAFGRLFMQFFTLRPKKATLALLKANYMALGHLDTSCKLYDGFNLLWRASGWMIAGADLAP
jgi:hypothetical protein